jgi:hypothetical protein
MQFPSARSISVYKGIALSPPPIKLLGSKKALKRVYSSLEGFKLYFLGNLYHRKFSGLVFLLFQLFISECSSAYPKKGINADVVNAIRM